MFVQSVHSCHENEARVKARWLQRLIASEKIKSLLIFMSASFLSFLSACFKSAKPLSYFRHTSVTSNSCWFSSFVWMFYCIWNSGSIKPFEMPSWVDSFKTNQEFVFFLCICIWEKLVWTPPSMASIQQAEIIVKPNLKQAWHQSGLTWGWTPSFRWEELKVASPTGDSVCWIRHTVVHSYPRGLSANCFDRLNFCVITRLSWSLVFQRAHVA